MEKELKCRRRFNLMIIQKIELQNFRPFYGPNNKLNISPKEDRNVILIKALNDVGKTSLFEALRFCLYGTKRAAASHVNRKASSENDGTMSVKLTFHHNFDQYEIIRQVDFKQNTDPNTLPDLKGDIQLKITKDGVPQKLETIYEQNDYVESILPKGASKYFLFDGEKIQEYTKHPPEKNAKDAIEMVLGIRELLNARDDLKTIENDLSRELDDLLRKQAKDKNEAEDIERKRKNTEKLKDEINSHTDQMRHMQEIIDACDKDLEKFKEIREKAKRRKALEEQVKSIQQTIDETDEQLRKRNKNAGILFVSPLLNILKSLSSPLTIPKQWERAAAKALMDVDYCICGAKMDEEIRKRLAPLASEFKLTKAERIKEDSTDLIADTEPKSLRKELFGLIEEKVGLEEDKKGIKGLIEDLNKEIKEDPEEKIQTLEKTRQKASEDLKIYRTEKDEKVGVLKKEEAEYKKRQHALATETHSEEIKQKQDHIYTCESARKAIEEVIDTLVETRKNDVEKLSSAVFKQLTNRPEYYEGIVIADDYELLVKTVGSEPRHIWRQDPSSGASQILATSFIAALNRYTAREAPVVIDTPIGRLDTIHKENLINFYPELGPQVIILYQPEELDDTDIAKIRQYVAKEYEFTRDLAYHPDITLIKEVG